MKYSLVRQAHRGFSGLYPENTLLSFRKAIEEGTEFIEMDLHLTRDRQVIIIHDESFDRTTNGTGWVWDMDLIDVKKLDAGQGERIPTLQEIIEFARPTEVRLCLELKYEPNTNDPMRAEPEAMETAVEVIKILHKTISWIGWLSHLFQPMCLRERRKLNPGYPLSLRPPLMMAH